MNAPKPATPLPWILTHQESFDYCFDIVSPQPDGGVYIASTGSSKDVDSPCGKNAAYIVAACNAYPQLLDDRARLLEALREIVCPTMDAWHNLTSTNAAKARALLRELGERS